MSRPQKSKSASSSREIAQNRRARFDYHLESRYEAGLVLEGWEVKSIRAGRMQLTGSYIGEIKGALFLMGAHITPLESASTHIVPDPDRPRKLLLNRREIGQIVGAIRERHRTCVCLSAHWHKGNVKVAIAVAAGKKMHDKRAAQRDRDWSRRKRRIMKSGGSASADD